MKKDPKLKVEIINPPTEKGIDPNLIKEPILIPLVRLMKEGKPPGDLFPILIKNDEGFCYFGTIALTKGNRILFFPGLKIPFVYDYNRNIGGTLEHITADETYSKSHVKCKDRDKKLTTLNITEKGPDYFYWFTLAFNNFEVFTQKNQGQITITVPKTDKARREREIVNAYNGGGIYFFELEDIIIKENEFLNFDFYFTKKARTDFSDIKLSSTIAKPIEQKRIICKVLIFNEKELSKNLLIVCYILEKKDKDTIPKDQAKFIFLEKIF